MIQLNFRKVFEITGYADTENGCAYCLNCLEEGDEEKFTPIFLGDEWDAPGPACDNCHALIEITSIYNNAIEHCLNRHHYERNKMAPRYQS